MARCLPKVESTDPSKQKPAQIQNSDVGVSGVPFQTSMPKARIDKEAGFCSGRILSKSI